MSKDKIAIERKVYQTTNYDQFKSLEGNRHRREHEIKRFARIMEEEGNLMDLFPIEVNEKLEVIDGQKRLGAARLNGMPVYYVVLPNTSISTVIARNSNTDNWRWLDFAQSWAERGNINYKRFIELWEEYRFNYKVLMRYCLPRGATFDNSSTEGWHDFRNGNFVINDFEGTKKLLNQCRELFEEAGLETLNRNFANALYGFMRTPSYDHQKMLRQIHQYGDGLTRCYTQAEFLQELVDIEKAKDGVLV